MKKAQATSKANNKFKKEVKDKDRDLHKLRKEIIELKHRNAGLRYIVPPPILFIPILMPPVINPSNTLFSLIRSHFASEKVTS